MTTDTNSYDKGLATGRRFREMENRGWDPGNTILALMVEHRDDADYVKGLENGLLGVDPNSSNS